MNCQRGCRQYDWLQLSDQSNYFVCIEYFHQNLILDKNNLSASGVELGEGGCHCNEMMGMAWNFDSKLFGNSFI